MPENHRNDSEERRQQETQREVLHQVRNVIWNMKTSGDIAQMVMAMQEGVQRLRIPFTRFGVNVVNSSADTLTVHFYTIPPEKNIRIETESVTETPKSMLVADLWRRQQVAYRKDLRSEDLYGEYLWCSAWDIVCVLDVPFSHGTLAVSSDEPGAFSPEDIRILGEMAKVLSEGFQRQEDLLILEQRNQDLERQERLLTSFHQIGQAVLETLDMDEILDRLASEITAAGLFRSLMIALVREAERRVEVVRNYMCYKGDWEGGRGMPGKYLHPGDRVVLRRGDLTLVTNEKTIGAVYPLDDENITPTVARTGRMEVIEEWSEQFDLHAGKPETRKGKVAYFIPVKKGDRVLAVLATGSEMADKEEMLRRIEMMQPLFDYVAIALDHARLYGQLQREVDERQRMEQKLVRLERLRAAGELSAGISHNLNNILTTVLGPAQILKRKIGDPELLREVDDIILSAQRAGDLIHKLHQSVRTDEEDSLYPVSVDQVVRQAVQTSRPRWKDESEARGVTVEMVVRWGDVPLIRGTEAGLHDILTNLIFNAIDAMPEGGTIAIRTDTVEDQVQLTFSDTGTGMAEATRLRVFEPFFTTKMDIGTGLGMSTVYNTVMHWGGTIEVDSTPGEGTTFALRFPMCTEEKAEESGKAAVGSARSGKILVVDDDQAVCSLLSRLLGELHEVETTTDGRKALARFARGKYDAVLIDLGMSGMSGDQLLQRMKEIDPGVATVLITGWTLPEMDTRVLSFDFRIEKPFGDLDEVEDVVVRAIALHDGRVEDKELDDRT